MIYEEFDKRRKLISEECKNINLVSAISRKEHLLAIARIDEDGGNIVVLEEEIAELWKQVGALHEKFRNLDKAFKEDFKAALAKEYGMERHARLDDVYRLAMRHVGLVSEGLECVERWFAELSALVLPKKENKNDLSGV